MYIIVYICVCMYTSMPSICACCGGVCVLMYTDGLCANWSIHTHTYIYFCTHIFRCTYTHIHLHIHTHIHMQMQIYSYNICIYIWIHINTYTPPQRARIGGTHAAWAVARANTGHGQQKRSRHVAVNRRYRWRWAVGIPRTPLFVYIRYVWWMYLCVAMCCGVLQCVAVCCSVLQAVEIPQIHIWFDSVGGSSQQTWLLWASYVAWLLWDMSHVRLILRLPDVKTWLILMRHNSFCWCMTQSYPTWLCRRWAAVVVERQDSCLID